MTFEEDSMNYKANYRILTYCIAAVWLINGLFCKVLDFVPRHALIVSGILGDHYARPLTLTIGLSEVAMSIWIISGIKSRLNAYAQIAIVSTMNILEFILVPDLLLWGRFNVLFAGMFLSLVYFNERYLNKQRV